jgi:aspartyl/asparaginyl beta-hydroxylase (cupin superfamily)
LKKYGKIVDGIVNDKFPTTINLLKDDQIHNAFFSILDPGVEIPPHTGYYKGYLRYHLGVKIPNGDEKAYIVCGGEKYTWKEKEGVLFDDMYLHYVKNPTKKQRVVLYLDVKRKSDNKFVNFINDVCISLMENSPVLKMFLKNQHTQKEINV